MLVQVYFNLLNREAEEIQNQKLTALNKMQIIRSGKVDARFATAQLRSQTYSQLSPTASFFHWLPDSIKKSS